MTQRLDLDFLAKVKVLSCGSERNPYDCLSINIKERVNLYRNSTLNYCVLQT